MKPSDALKLHREDIRRVVEHGDDTEDSDLDLLAARFLADDQFRT